MTDSKGPPDRRIHSEGPPDRRIHSEGPPDRRIRLIWAQEELLAAEIVDRFVAQATDDDEVLSVVCEADVEGLEEALFATSLFATRRFVVVRGAEQLRKAGLERLGRALRSPDVPADVLVVATAERRPAPLFKELSEVAEVTTLERPRRGQLVAWVAKRMKDAGLRPDRQAAGALVETLGEGLRDLAQAVDQLRLRLGRQGAVTREVVAGQFTATGDQPIWTLFDGIVAHDAAKAYGALHRILRQGDAPLAILGALVSQIRYLLRTRSLVQRSGSLDERALASELGVSPGRAAVLRKQSARLSEEWLLGVHRLLAEADFELKGGEDGAVLPPEVVLERVVAGALDAG